MRRRWPARICPAGIRPIAREDIRSAWTTATSSCCTTTVREAWQPADRSALLIHGLGGCHDSGYMQRIAHKLNARGVRVFRMDLRGCGAGMGLARLPYHSGRSEDARAALAAIARICRNSPTTLVGFSLGANMSLKLLGELEHAAVRQPG